ncbi:DUF4097 family beta strand repeat-containing protein [Actinokineospora bangkokensis]|uniref:DUF4097 domain-containing protein n=1 Tax=Actinokineospora bangkokensis TaxID=1193682 RepID=A0A1Q9LQ38_9PSEU|nr:DUF4097 family beta strand repeat-containing protein [Actinokineospora bangkokensis]OLR94148.1 hypothetical protein BJP25_10095 [Actinokineospora bangkokensis]
MSTPSRVESFEAGSPVHLDLTATSGRVEVRLTDEPGVHVEVRHAPDAGSAWAEGLAGLLSWVGGQLGEQAAEAPAEAVRRTRVELAAGRLVVRTPTTAPLRAVPLGITVLAPEGSRITAQTGSAAFTATGTADAVEVTAGSGTVDVAGATGGVQVTANNGTVRIGPTGGGVRARTGSGEVDVAAVAAPSTITTSGGDVHLASVGADVLVRTGSGAITVAEATAGKLELTTGSGALSVLVRPGTPAEVDLSSGSGAATAELPLSGTRPDTAPGLRVRGRSGSGDVRVGLARS